MPRLDLTALEFSVQEYFAKGLAPSSIRTYKSGRIVIVTCNVAGSKKLGRQNDVHVYLVSLGGGAIGVASSCGPGWSFSSPKLLGEGLIHPQHLMYICHTRTLIMRWQLDTRE